MDISAYNTRARAEAGTFVPLKDPYTGEPIGTDEDAPGFVIRGVASKTVQDALAEAQRKAKRTKNKAQDDKAVMEALHQQTIESAMKYIITAKNLDIDGKPVDADKGKIRAILDYTFPELAGVKDDDGNAVMMTIQNDDGKDVQIPKMEVTNKTFAMQVTEAAEDTQAFLGN